MIRTACYFTTDLRLLNKQLIYEEIQAQGVDKMMFHLSWKSYFVFSCQLENGYSVTIHRYSDYYKMKGLDTVDWRQGTEAEVMEFIRSILYRIRDGE